MAVSSPTAVASPPASIEEAGVARPDLINRIVLAGRQPVSPASVAAFRIIFGLVGVAAVVRFVANGWVSDVYIEPAYHFTYAGFAWVQPWPAWGMYLHFGMLGLGSLGVALGYRYRLSIAAFFLLFTYFELIDQTTYLNHYYLVSLLSLIMVFSSMARAASPDAFLATRRTSSASPATAIPISVLWLLRGQLGLVYVFAGIAKLNPDWLLHAQPLTIWLYNSADTPFIGGLVQAQWVAYAMSWAGTIFDLTIVPFLLWRKTRPYSYVVLVLFHVATGLLFPAIGMFPWIMMGAALIFFDPDWPLRLATRLRGSHGPQTRTPPPQPSYPPGDRPSWRVQAVFFLVAAFLAVQVLVPLRHLAYPGNARWTEEGYHLTWRVLITEKTGLVRFRVKSSATDGERLVYPDDYLTPTQVERMASQPDLVLATAHIIREDFTRRGHPAVEVRADVYVAFNGRPAARLIDPAVDLAAIGSGIGPKPWVLPPTQ